MESRILQKLKIYNNPASIDMLNGFIKSNNFNVIFEFNRISTVGYFKNIKSIFNIKNLYYINDLSSITSEKIDAIFIMIPYDRKDRENIVDWGIKYNKPIFILEAGFISSLYPMQIKDSPISFNVDSTGSIYLLGDKENQITNFLNSDYNLNDNEVHISKKIINMILNNKLSKYNHQCNIFSDSRKDSVLIIDQSYNDFSIQAAEASIDVFNTMVRTAIIENPDKKIFIKCHPDVLVGKRKGNIDILRYLNRDNIYILDKEYLISTIFKYIEQVYTVSSTLGFEALMYNKVVKCFGKSFYSGWGLTKDYVTFKNRKRLRNINELAYAIYVNFTYYCNALNYNRCNAVDAIDSMATLIKQYRYNNFIIFHNYKNLSDRIDSIEDKVMSIERLCLYSKNEFISIVKDEFNKIRSNNGGDKILDNIYHRLNTIELHVLENNYNKNKEFNIRSVFYRFIIFIEKTIFNIVLKGKLNNKYNRNRALFFEDSKVFLLKKYYNIVNKMK